MDLPTIDMIRTGKNINRLRKQANWPFKPEILGSSPMGITVAIG